MNYDESKIAEKVVTYIKKIHNNCKASTFIAAKSES